MEFELKAVADALGLTLESEARVIVGRDARVIVGSDARVTGWSIDSRTVAPGDLFFALRGPNHDGNAYVEEVSRKGAVAAVANIPLADERGSETPTLSRDRQGAVAASYARPDANQVKQGQVLV